MRLTLLQSKGTVGSEEFKIELDRQLADLAGTLSATARFHSFTKQGWATVDIEGDDFEVLTELVSHRFGLATNGTHKIELYGNYLGVVKKESSDLLVDTGLEQNCVIVRLNALRAQLADGKTLSGRTIAEHYCLRPGTSISIRISRIVGNDGKPEGWMSDAQMSLFSDWIRCGLDRVQVFNCLASRLSYAIGKLQLERDIILTQQINLTTHSIVCKIGTDAIGVIPRLGGILRGSELVPFIPTRIQEKCEVWTESLGI